MTELTWFDVREHKQLSQSLVTIVVKRWTKFQDGLIAITPQMTAAEIDATIQALKDELDLVGKKAKAVAQ